MERAEVTLLRLNHQQQLLPAAHRRHQVCQCVPRVLQTFLSRLQPEEVNAESAHAALVATLLRSMWREAIRRVGETGWDRIVRGAFAFALDSVGRERGGHCEQMQAHI